MFLGPQNFAIAGEFLPSGIGNCVAEESDDEKRVDVWAKDYPADDGDAPSNIIPVWIGPDVWNNRTGLVTGAHENPVAGRTNYLYARVRNRGADIAHATSVDFWVARSGIGLNWPDAFTWIGRLHAPRVAGDGSSVTLGPLQWTPPAAAGVSHYAIYARINSPVDPIPPGYENESIVRNVRNQNNIVWKNLQVMQLVPLDVLRPIAGYSRPKYAVAKFDVLNNSTAGEQADFMIEVTGGQSRRKSDIFLEIPRTLTANPKSLPLAKTGFAVANDPGLGAPDAELVRVKMTGNVAHIRGAVLEPGRSNAIRLLVLAEPRYDKKASIEITKIVRGQVVDGMRLEVVP